MNDDKKTAVCMFAQYVESIVNIMRVLGVDATVAMLRRNADDLEANRVILERKRVRQRQVGRA